MINKGEKTVRANCRLLPRPQLRCSPRLGAAPAHQPCQEQWGGEISPPAPQRGGRHRGGWSEGQVSLPLGSCAAAMSACSPCGPRSGVARPSVREQGWERLGPWLPISDGECAFPLLGQTFLPFSPNPVIPDVLCVSDTWETLALE